MGQQKERFVFDVLLESLEQYEEKVKFLKSVTNEKLTERDLTAMQKDMQMLIKAAKGEREKLSKESEVKQCVENDSP